MISFVYRKNNRNSWAILDLSVSVPVWHKISIWSIRKPWKVVLKRRTRFRMIWILVAPITANDFWRSPFNALCDSKHLVEYIVCDVNALDQDSKPHVYGRESQKVCLDLFFQQARVPSGFSARLGWSLCDERIGNRCGGQTVFDHQSFGTPPTSRRYRDGVKRPLEVDRCGNRLI